MTVLSLTNPSIVTTNEMIPQAYTQIPARAKKIPVPVKDEDYMKCHPNKGSGLLQ